MNVKHEPGLVMALKANGIPLSTLSEEAVYQQFVANRGCPGRVDEALTAEQNSDNKTSDTGGNALQTVSPVAGSASTNLWLRMLEEEPRLHHALPLNASSLIEEGKLEQKKKKTVTWRQCVAGDVVGGDDVWDGSSGRLPQHAQESVNGRRVSEVISSYVCNLCAQNVAYRVPIPQPSLWQRTRQTVTNEIARLRTCTRSEEGESASVGSGRSETRGSPGGDQSPTGGNPEGEEEGEEEEENDAHEEADPRYRDILYDVSVEVPAGQMVAVLGGSGSGKTSLLDVLSGRSPKDCVVSGSITINGKEVTAQSDELKYSVGYVTQAIYLLPNLTVRETLKFSAMLRLPVNLMPFEKMARLEQVMDFLHLTEFADRLIGGAESKGLSGGQKRLVTIAMQMMYNPGVLILDEPTSGLDSYTAQHVCETLQSLATRRNRAILLTIHQPGPEITCLFDHVLLISSGHTIFNGPACELTRYFSSIGYTLPDFTNPCDYYVDLATLDTRSSVRENLSRQCFVFLVNAYRDYVDGRWAIESDCSDNELEVDQDQLEASSGKNDDGDASTSASSRRASEIACFRRKSATSSLSASEVSCKHRPERPKQIGAFMQLVILLRRTVRNELRSYDELLSQTCQGLLLSVLFGVIFFQLGTDQADLRNRKAVLFISFTLYPFMAVFETIAKFAGQQQMLYHELINGLYTTIPFGIAKILGELPGHIVLAVTYSLPIYWMSGLKTDEVSYFRYLVIIFLLLQQSRFMALIASILHGSPNYAALTANLIFTGWILTAGYIINIENLWYGVQWISYVGPIRYAFQAACITELEGRQFGGSSCNATQSCTRLSGEADLETLGFASLSFNECITIMGAMVAFCFLFVLVSLWLKRNSRPMG